MPCALNPQNDPNRSHVRKKNSPQRTTIFGKRTNSGSYPENQSRSGSRHVCPQGLTSASLCMHQGQCWTARHASVLGGAAGAHPPRGQFPLAVWRAQWCRLVGCSTAHIYHSEAWYRIWQADKNALWLDAQSPHVTNFRLPAIRDNLYGTRPKLRTNHRDGH